MHFMILGFLLGNLLRALIIYILIDILHIFYGNVGQFPSHRIVFLNGLQGNKEKLAGLAFSTEFET